MGCPHKLTLITFHSIHNLLHSRSRLAAVEATLKGTRVVREIAVHVVGNDKPALLYSMILLYQPPRGKG